MYQSLSDSSRLCQLRLALPRDRGTWLFGDSGELPSSGMRAAAIKQDLRADIARRKIDELSRIPRQRVSPNATPLRKAMLQRMRLPGTARLHARFHSKLTPLAQTGTVGFPRALCWA